MTMDSGPERCCGSCRFFRPTRRWATKKALLKVWGSCSWRPSIGWLAAYAEPRAISYQGVLPELFPLPSPVAAVSGRSCPVFELPNKEAEYAAC